MAMHLRFSCRGVCLTVMLGFAAWVPAISATTFTVGTGPNCTHSTVASAVASSEGSAGPDTVRVTRSAAYTQQAISFSVTQEVTITGGFSDCNTNVEDANYTTLSGSGGAAATVMTISGSTGSIVHLRKLTITGGDIASPSSILGGGIYYTGDGLLDIADSSISNNTGAYGGGINVNGTSPAAGLDIGPDTTISGNTAIYNGGGLFSNNIETVIRGDNILITDNHALGVTSNGNTTGGSGGGIYVRACALNSIVYLGSPGRFGFGVVYNNTARLGGGVSVVGGSCTDFKTAELRMFSTSATNLTKIQSNSASAAGGGIYLEPNPAVFFGQTYADASVWNAEIDDNIAPNGSAVFYGAGYPDVVFNPTPQIGYKHPRPDGAADCAYGVSCGQIRGNISSSTGQVIYGEDGRFAASRIKISGNSGSELIRLPRAVIYDSLISDNTSTLRLIETNQLTLNGTTIAGNTIGTGGPQVLGVNTGGHASIDTAIIWQPGKLALHNDGDTPQVLDVLSNNISTLIGSGSARLIQAEPRFVDPAHGDYSLTAASEAVDFAPAVDGDDRDMFGHRRDLDFALFYNEYGPRDLGALEREAEQPLVLNGTFDANVNIWPEVTVGASSWDGTQNAPGTPAGGALHVLTTGTSISARKQCVHLPGPGTYTLNGWGKSTGSGPFTTGSYVRLGWEYRSAGSETCGGTVTASGNLLLANTGTWRRPATPATIVVSNFAWTTDSSILVYLVVEDGPGSGIAPEAPTATLNGWFDGITLDVLSDRIFANGFD